MILIIGLGNPGKNFQNTPHNLGFLALDKFREKNHFPYFKREKQFNAEITKGYLGKKLIILAKPQTFMNNSGQAAKKIITKLHLSLDNLILVHDETDLLFGEMRISKNHGSAGHKGVESIIKAVGSKNFIRLRLGSWFEEKKSKSLNKFVLRKFPRRIKKQVKELTIRAEEALKIIITAGIEKAMTKVNASSK